MSLREPCRRFAPDISPRLRATHATVEADHQSAGSASSCVPLRPRSSALSVAGIRGRIAAASCIANGRRERSVCAVRLDSPACRRHVAKKAVGSVTQGRVGITLPPLMAQRRLASDISPCNRRLGPRPHRSKNLLVSTVVIDRIETLECVPIRVFRKQVFLARRDSVITLALLAPPIRLRCRSSVHLEIRGEGETARPRTKSACTGIRVDRE